MKFVALAFVLLATMAYGQCPTIAGAPSGVTLNGIPQWWTTWNSALLSTFNASFSFCGKWQSPPMVACSQSAAYVAENVAGCAHNTWDNVKTNWYWGSDQQAHVVYGDTAYPGYIGIVNIGCGTSALSLKNVTGVANNVGGWNWTFQMESSYMCSGSNSCQQWNDCYSCTTASSGNCGWCSATAKCSVGTSSGPSAGFCATGSWDWVSGNCPVQPTAAPMTYAPVTYSPSSGCSSWTSCYTCTTAPTGNCGWCANTNTCSQGTASGPSMGSCVSWDWISNECPATPPPVTMAPDHCTAFTTCATCTTASAPYCGWCANTNSCSAGTANGPSTGSCVSWDWLQNECPAGVAAKLPEPVGKPRSPHSARPKRV